MKILIITNLYPLPWEPNRATFNKQQFDRLSANHDLSILVPVAWKDYLAKRKLIKAEHHKASNERLKFVCYWYTPKVLQSLYGFFMSLSIWLAAKNWIKQVDYDCILGSWAHPDGYAASKIANKLGKPYFIKVHGSDINLLTQDKVRKDQISRLCREAAHIFSPSDALKNKIEALGVEANKITRNYNGVDTALFYPEDRLSPYFLFVGNLKQDKGVLDLLEAYSGYREAGGQFALRYIGAGTMMAILKDRVTQLGLQDQVTLTGAMKHEQVAPYLRACQVLILPSYHEGVPNVLLEAANCGVPVIATRVGGIPEVVIEGETGILTEAGDVEALKLAMLEAQDETRWDRNVILSRGKQFSWDENIQRVEQRMLDSLALIQSRP